MVLKYSALNTTLQMCRLRTALLHCRLILDGFGFLQRSVTKVTSRCDLFTILPVSHFHWYLFNHFCITVFTSDTATHLADAMLINDEVISLITQQQSTDDISVSGDRWGRCLVSHRQLSFGKLSQKIGDNE